MAAYTEPNNLKDFLVWEEEREYSRDEVTILSGESLSIGEVVGKIKTSVPTTGAAGSNTGNGTCTGVTGGSKTKVGTYTLVCIEAATDAGTFEVIDPDGNALPEATGDVAYANDHINFTINVGATDYVAGDEFTIAVSEGSLKVVAIDLDAVDGSEDAAGIVIADYDASGGDIQGVIIARDAIITTSHLVWPADIITAEKTAALAQLAALGIITRGES